MEENNIIDREEGGSPKIKGRGAGIAGFVIVCVTLLFWLVIYGICALMMTVGNSNALILASGWTAVGLIGLGLSINGYRNLRNSGGSKGLALAGIITGIVVLVMNVYLYFRLYEIKRQMADIQQELQDGFSKLKKEMEGSLDSLKQSSDSVK